MASPGDRRRFSVLAIFLAFLVFVADGTELFYEWHVAIDPKAGPVSDDQPVITINGLFPGPLLNTTTDDIVHINVFNHLDEPLLFTWNGIQQRRNSWQDGVSGTNCPIQPGKNWTYVFQMKDQIGTFFYFPSINFQKAGGGFGPIRINNREVVSVPFPKPEAEFDLLIGDWYQTSYKDARNKIKKVHEIVAYETLPDRILMNGKGSYTDLLSKSYESFTVTKGMTYRIRISNVGIAWSFNFRIQNHTMVLVETEGSYTSQVTLDSLDVHVGQSYSVLVTADQDSADYYMVAAPKLHNAADLSRYGVGVLHYDDSDALPVETLPSGPDPFDLEFSINQARSISWNLTTGAAWPNPQATFNVRNVTLLQTFVLRASIAEIGGVPRLTINNVSYLTPKMPLKLAEHFADGFGTYELDKYPTNSKYPNAEQGVFVASGTHKGWIELVFRNELDTIDSWHLDGFGFNVVGFGDGEWTPELRSTYNILDPVVRSTVQVYPGRWTAVYAYLDNPGIWNLRSQHLKNWYLGEELYVRVHDPDPNPAKEKPSPPNLLLCGGTNESSSGKIGSLAPSPALAPSPLSSASSMQSSWFYVFIICVAVILNLGH